MNIPSEYLCLVSLYSQLNPDVLLMSLQSSDAELEGKVIETYEAMVKYSKSNLSWEEFTVPAV